MTKLMGYTFRIQYKLGATNSAADALSRREEVLELNAISVAHVAEVSRLDSKVQSDEKLAGILQDLLLGQQHHPGYSVKGGIYFFKVVWFYQRILPIFQS